MILDSITEKITLVLAGATTTTAGDIYGSWTDSDPAATPKFNAGSNTATTSGTSSVDVIPAPGASTARRSVDEISVCNNDTQPMAVTIRHSDGATHRRVFGPCTLQVGEKIQYKRDSGWNVFTMTGAVKVTAVQSTVEPGYIDGMKLTWNSGTSVTISSGSLYIPSVGANVNYNADTLKSGLVLSASTFYHLYAYLNSGIPDVEIVTTAPSSPYNGVARTKTGDTTRRYIGSILTDGSGNVHDFSMNPETSYIQYRKALTNAAPFRVLSAGGATVPTNISLTGIVPTTATIGYFRGVNTSTASGIFFYVNSTYASGDIMGNVQQAPAGTTFTGDLIMPCPAQNIAYAVVSGTGAFLDVKGYWYER